jgi:hypothetical protein
VVKETISMEKSRFEGFYRKMAKSTPEIALFEIFLSCQHVNGEFGAFDSSFRL